MRDTIRQRGTARMVLVPVTFIGWAATAAAMAMVMTRAPGTLVPLVVLAAGFETILALHMNVERIGRYLQVFHEREGGWEQVAMKYGQRFPAGGPDPLFGQLFVIAAAINFLPAVLAPGQRAVLAIVAVLHLLLVYRIRTARAAAARQRADDLQRFEQLRTELHR